MSITASEYLVKNGRDYEVVWKWIESDGYEELYENKLDKIKL